MALAVSSSLCKTPQQSSFFASLQTSNSPQINFQSLRPTSPFNQKTTFRCCKLRRSCASFTSNSSLAAAAAPLLHETNGQTHWTVLVKAPSQQQAGSRPDVIDYYVQILERVLGSEKDAQACIYHACCDTQFGFCCVVDEETSKKLACLPEVLSVKPDPDFSYVQKDYSDPNAELSSNNYNFPLLFPAGKHWFVHVEMPESFITRAQLVDYYTGLLTNVLGNEKDAQMCMYHISLQPDYGFYCELDDECAKKLTSVPGVISVRPDKNVKSNDKGYNLQQSSNSRDITKIQPTNITTKKLFVTGLSFYTSEKTLRAAFEGFGELVEVKIIMDKISKRSKGYAFIEYTTEEAATAALREMNGKIINGWMIVVDVAKTNPPKYSRGRPRPET